METHSHLINGFGLDRLDEEVLSQDEQLLVNVVADNTRTEKHSMNCELGCIITLVKRNLLIYHALPTQFARTLNEHTSKHDSRMWLESPVWF